MRSRILMAASGLVSLLACGPSSEPQASSAPPPATTLDVPPMDAGAPAPKPAPIATDAAPAAEPIADGDPGTPPPSDEFDRARDPLAKRQQRDRAMLVTELQGLSSLLAATPVTAPDRPMVQKRVGESYLELARAEGEPQASTHRKAAIKNFNEIIQNTPAFTSLDDVFYEAGYAYEKVKDFANARRNYYELIKRYPSSKWIPYAYYAFGEMFFHEAQAGDAMKYDLAKQAYAEVLKYPSSDVRTAAQKRKNSIPNHP